MAGTVEYKRRCPSALDSLPHLGKLDAAVVEDYHMPEPQLSNPRKRQCPGQDPFQPNKTSQPLSKRQKLIHFTDGYQPPAAFWDNLSKLWLTRRALRELDRRNTQPASNPSRLSYQQPHRPVTRSAVVELQKNRHTIQSAPDFLCYCALSCLKDIKIFARHGGPDLADLRGCSKPVDSFNQTMNSRHSSSRGRKRGSKSTSNTKPITSTTTTKSTGPYDRAFEQNLIDGGVYPDEYEYPDGRIPPQPNNWEEINRRLTQPRSSLSPSRFSDEDFRRFRRAQAHAPKEKQVTTSVIPIVEGEIGDAKCSSGGIQFTNLAHLTDGTIVPGNPDLYYGARPEQLDRRVRKELSRHIIPSTQDSLPTAPNFFLAVKGPDGSLTVAGRQACYDGALGARGIHSLQEYGQDEAVYDNNAYTITSIYYDGYLKMYTSHPTQPSSPGGRPEYFMNQLRSFAMTDTTARFREGAAAFRNARDWTKEKRNEFIDAANARRANDSQAETSAIDASGFGLTSSLASEVSLAEPYSTESLGQESRTSLNEDFNTASHLQESETSTDELVLDYRLPAKRSTKHSKREHQPQRKRRDTGDSSGA